MANGFALELQKGVRAALIADTGITNLVSTRVFDEPPQNPTFPFVRFDQIEPQVDDTDGSIGADVILTIQAFSRSTGRVEATQIAEAIRAALHRKERSVALSGFNLINMICESFYIDRQSNDRGHEATVVLKAMLQTA